MNPGHQPQRFEEFTLLPNQRSFTIKDSAHVFHMDRYGGWFDEYGNYYNQKCEADDPPSSSESYSHEDEKQQQVSSQQDEFEKEFGKPSQLQDQQEQEEVQILASIAQNHQILTQYPRNTYIRIYFDNFARQSKRTEVLNAYREVCKGILSINLSKSYNDGYFVVDDYENALVLIQQEGKKLFERPLYFQVEKYEENLLNPISQSELNAKEEFKPKKYVPKQGQQSKTQESKKLEIPWKWYKFEKNTFPKKTFFKNWMSENGFIFQQDFKNIEKIENDLEKKYVKVEMKQSTFNSLNGLQYQGKKVEFLPLSD